MSYLVERLPKDLAISVLWGIGMAVVGGFATAIAFGWFFAKQYPHDGQDGLGALAVGIISVPLWGAFTALVVFGMRGLQYRKLVRREQDAAFEAELLKARLSDRQDLNPLGRR